MDYPTSHAFAVESVISVDAVAEDVAAKTHNTNFNFITHTKRLTISRNQTTKRS